jgi:hypothetical protein
MINGAHAILYSDDAEVARRCREQFTGWIAGLGTASGHRVVIGHWPASPYGAVPDVMVEDPAGHRTLYAPHPSWPSSSPPLTTSTTSKSPPAVPDAQGA